MKRRRQTTCLVAALLFLASLPVVAQTTGRLRGTVLDQDGLALPGATVTVSGETLMGGSRVAITGETGAFRFAALPPGVYNVIAELDGFKPESLAGVKVSVNATASANFVVYPADFTEVVTVSSEAPLVDVSSSSSGATFSADFLQDLPTNRNFYDVMQVSPGVSEGAADGGDRVVAFGSDVQSNAWYTDGVEVTGPETGTSWVSMNPDMIEQVQVMGVGAPAEFGNMQGAALNVVTKSGSNQFRGSFNFFWFNDSMVDSAIDFEGSEFSEYVQAEPFRDITATFGGPIKKDRAWFFLAYENWRDAAAFPGTNPDTTPTNYQDRYDAKLSTRINDKNFLDLKFQFNDWGFPAAADQFSTPSAVGGEVGDDTMWALNYQSIFSDRTYLEARYSGWKSNDDNLSTTGSSDPAFIDYSPPGGGPTRYFGGLWYPWQYDTSTDQFNVTVSHFADDFLKGDHDFKFGIQANNGEAKTVIAPSANGTYYYHYTYNYDYYGTIYPYEYYYKIDGNPYYYGNEQELWGVFIDDSWAVSDRLTINLGLRFDRSTGIIPAFDILNATGQPTGEQARKIDPVFTWDNWSPRLGFAYNAGANRQTVIRGSFGVYYDGNVGGNWNYPPSFVPPQFYSTGESWNGPWEEQGVWWDPLITGVDPDLEAPRTLQYSLGFERQFKSVYSYGAMVVYKDSTNGIGWEILDDGIYEPLEWTDPFNGRSYTLLNPIEFPTIRKGNGPGFTVDGRLDDYWAEYTGLVLTFNRRFADWWGLQSSYTYSNSEGLNPRALSDWQNNPMYGSKAGSHVNQWLNSADGQLLLGDRPHMLRVLANFQLPWKLRFSTSINLQSGRPYTRQARAPFEVLASTQRDFIADPASDDLRFDFQDIVNFTIGRDWPIPGNGILKTDLQFFNILNSTAIDNWVDYTLDAGDVFVPTMWVVPRRLMIRVGVQY